MRRGKREAPKHLAGASHHSWKGPGFTNCMAVSLIALLFFGMAGSFILGYLSIKYGYTGALACWTAIFAPIGTAISIVLVRVVDKSRDENTGANGEGIKYAMALAEVAGAALEADEGITGSENSPGI